MSSESTETFDTVTMFGADWCSDCRRSKALLDSLGVDYDYVDVETSKAGADRAQAVSGRTSIPVIVFPDSSGRIVTVQVEPSDAELTAQLRSIGVLARHT